MKRHNLISIAIFSLLIFGGLQFASSGAFADPDGFYHAKASQLLAVGELADKFPWLQGTTWADRYADQHYLYHWLLVPFNNVEILHWSVVVFGVTFVVLFWLLLKKFGIKAKLFWVALMLLGSVDFLFRVNLVKANTISLTMLCAIVLLIQYFDSKACEGSNQKRGFALSGVGIVSGVFTWTYGGFVLVPVVLGIYTIVHLFYTRNLWHSTLPFLAASAGIILALFLHPQSNHLISLLNEQIFHTGLGAGSVVPAGNEWLPFQLYWFVKSNIALLLVWGFSLVLFAKNYRKNFSDTTTVWMQLTSLGLLALTLWHRRFIEYFVPFLVFASALTFKPYLIQISWSEVKTALRFWQTRLAAIILSAIALVIFAYSFQSASKMLAQGEPVTKFESAATWLEQNSQQGEIVFNTQWDQFPQLFYWNSHNYYIVGLDPTFMYLKDRGKYWLWRKVADDDPKQWESVEELYRIVYTDFNSQYILLDKSKNLNLAVYLPNNTSENLFEKSFEDSEILIFKLKADSK
jgi:hypothetical protein